MTEEQAQEMVQLPRGVVLDAIPMLFWVSQAMRWDDPTHQEALRALYREAAAVFGITAYEVDAEEPVASQQMGGARGCGIGPLWRTRRGTTVR